MVENSMINSSFSSHVESVKFPEKRISKLNEIEVIYIKNRLNDLKGIRKIQERSEFLFKIHSDFGLSFNCISKLTDIPKTTVYRLIKNVEKKMFNLNDYNIVQKLDGEVQSDKSPPAAIQNNQNNEMPCVNSISLPWPWCLDLDDLTSDPIYNFVIGDVN